ncbi:hypothetical protein PBI_SUZY_7 [Gordonia phage Suzy]|uniref:Uncharacterized protein n=1 Tax=Gordonia phage Suzy TaxID=2201430 RepID=A0A2Z4Q7T0_9CAUD|nr:hypothetical protein HOT44_gp07 [Gordonia phage Suzy]AWY06112.1 hypothetical protein PBI_SUZY_7 [Gordonia phage Suzy]
MALKARKFKIRFQLRPRSSKKPQRISLVSQRRIVVNGKTVKAGQKVDLTDKKHQLKAIVAKPKATKNPRGAKQATIKAVRNVKAGKINGG